MAEDLRFGDGFAAGAPDFELDVGDCVLAGVDRSIFLSRDWRPEARSSYLAPGMMAPEVSATVPWRLAPTV
ncbi:MAG: hypothetical protein NTV52_25735 [Acidobacteria bacterium]|nr:hypothetical protein [Acidobacteriota bacterium]